MPGQVKLGTTAIDNEKAALLLLINEMQNASNDEERDNLKEALETQAAKLQSLCDELQAKADDIIKDNPKNESMDAVVEVVLTPEQRSRVLAKTGVDVPSIKIPDPSSELTKNMQYVQPDFIELRAIIQAENFKQLMEDMEQASAESTEEEENNG